MTTSSDAKWTSRKVQRPVESGIAQVSWQEMLGNALRDVSKKSREPRCERDRRDWHTAFMVDCIEACNMARNCIFIFGCAKVGDQHVKNMWREVEVGDQVPANQFEA
jgi:hypothetical protein